MKKRIIYTFLIPSSIILISLFALNQFNKNKIRNNFENLTLAQGITFRNLIEVSGSHLSLEGEASLHRFLETLFKNPGIIYIGLFKGEELSFLLSRYEGYFPIVKETEKFYILDSPVGKIFDTWGSFPSKEGNNYKLHIGFDYQFLVTFEDAASRNFIIITVLFLALVLLVTSLVIYFEKRFHTKEMELERAKQEKERFMELSLLTSEIAHEIKNPLNSIYLSFNTLEKYLEEDEQARFYRDALKEEIKRINRVIQSYSDLSKEIHPQYEKIDLNHRFTDFKAMMSEELKAKGTELIIEIPDNTHFRTDGDLLKQILLNLTKNAMEAGAKKLEISGVIHKKTLYLVIQDDGQGMDETTAKTIFKPYVSGKTTGMGLGLHIVLKITRSLKGEIKLVDYQPGHTKFMLKIPQGEAS